METFHTRLAGILRQDPGGRGFAPAAAVPDLQALTARLAACRRALIVTGFPVMSAGVGETDGPPGAAHIAAALGAVGAQVWIATDDRSLEMTARAAALAAPAATVVRIPDAGHERACGGLLEQVQPDLILAIERPGMHADGHYHSARGQVIDALVAETDHFFRRPGGAVTVAIGDGGNELGMGALRDAICAAVPGGAQIAAHLGCDFPLAAGVSNWWGWGIQALLSVACGRSLLPTDEAETALLAAVVEASAVDGLAGVPQLTVDGLTLEENLAVLDQIRRLTAEVLP